MHLHTLTLGGRKEWTTKQSGDQLTKNNTTTKKLNALKDKRKKSPEVKLHRIGADQSTNKEHKALCDVAVGCQ